MTKKNQQIQVKKAFENHANKWLKKAKKNDKNSINMIKQRNYFVEDIAKKFLKKGNKILDVGCGTGDLVLALQKSKFDAFGIDFAKSMIKKASLRANRLHLDKEKFSAVSFFDFKTDLKFKMISANGFIEYISKKELEKFLKNSYFMLDKNGFLVFSSRNRLFNVFSNNEYTNSEIKMSNITELIKECIIFNDAKNFKNIYSKKFKSKIRSNLKLHNRKGSDIPVSTRYQYTPFQLMDLLKNNGFKTIELYPIHIHVFPTNTRNNPPKIHDNVSNHIQNQKNIPIQFITQSSSFMIVARKK